MLTRIITAVILIAAVLVWLFVAPYDFFTIGALFIYMVGAYEMGPLLGYKSRLPFIMVACAAATLAFFFMPPALYISEGIPKACQYLIASGLIVWFGSIPLLLKFPNSVSWHKNHLLNTILALLMLLPFLEGLLVLRASSYGSDQHEGSRLVLCVMALVWCADSGAYFAGRFFGKHKMLPNVSPKKTMEGLFGGLVTAVIGMLVFLKLGYFGQYGDNYVAVIGAGILAIVMSVIGDLVESMFKRLSNIKDSGRIFPGHGGMLDRIDSQLAAIPVFITFVYLLSGALF